MENHKQQIEKLAQELINLYINEGYGNTLNEYLEMMELTLVLIDKSKKNELEENELNALRNLINEVINFDFNENNLSLKSFKRRKLCELMFQIKEEVKNNPCLQLPKEEPTNFNSWIRSLKIFKIGSNGLEDSIYETSYDLYQQMRKIILNRKSPSYQKIYLTQIVDKLELKNSKFYMEMEQYDYELYQIVRLVNKNPDMNYHDNNHKLGNLALTKARVLTNQTNINRVNLILKENNISK